MNDDSINQLKTNQYDKGYKWLHWVTACLVILMFMATFGFAQATTDPAKIEMLMGHSTIGSLVFMLFVIRFFKRFVFKSPHPEVESHKTVATIGHTTLYLLLLYVPVTGYLTARAHELPVYWFGKVNLSNLNDGHNANFELLRNFHELGVKALMVMVLIHVAAAVHHGLIKKDGVFGSMWPGKRG